MLWQIKAEFLNDNTINYNNLATDKLLHRTGTVPVQRSNNILETMQNRIPDSFSNLFITSISVSF